WRTAALQSALRARDVCHSLQFQIDQTVRRGDTVFVFHVLSRAKIDSSTGVFNQERTRGDVPQTDSRFNVCVESSARHVSHVERRAAEYAAFAHAMNHLLEQREIRVDRLSGFGETDRDNGFGELRAIAHLDRSSV